MDMFTAIYSWDRAYSAVNPGELYPWLIGSAIGGFGSHVAQLLAEEGVFDSGLKFRSMVLPDNFIDQAAPSDMYAIAGLNAADIEAKVLDVLGIASIDFMDRIKISVFQVLNLNKKRRT